MLHAEEVLYRARDAESDVELVDVVGVALLADMVLLCLAAGLDVGPLTS